MKLRILAITMVLIMLLSSYSMAARINIQDIKNRNIPKIKECENSNILFRDDFDEWNTDWHIITEFSSFDLHHGMAELTIWKAWRFMYSNAEMRTVSKFKFNDLKIKTQINNSWARAGQFGKPKTGSFGFGYWNHIFHPKHIAYAWFFYSRSDNPFYPKNGLWAICKSPYDDFRGGFSLVEIKGYEITDWHDYEIKWNENSVDFLIDGENVAHITKGVPQVEMQMNLWQDNAAWYGFEYNGDIFYPKMQRVKTPNMAFIDYVEITE